MVIAPTTLCFGRHIHHLDLTSVMFRFCGVVRLESGTSIACESWSLCTIIWAICRPDPLSLSANDGLWSVSIFDKSTYPRIGTRVPGLYRVQPEAPLHEQTIIPHTGDSGPRSLSSPLLSSEREQRPWIRYVFHLLDICLRKHSLTR